MNEQEIFNILSSFHDAINVIMDKMETLENDIKSANDKAGMLEHTLYEDILNPAKDAMNQAEKENRFNDFRDKYQDKFKDFIDPTKAIEGDNFDIMKTAFDEYENYDTPEGEEKPSLDDFVNAFTESIGGQLADVKKKLGIQGDIKIEQTVDGETTVNLGGKTATSEAPETAEANLEETPEVPPEAPENGEKQAEETPKEIIVSDDMDEDEQDDPSELAEYTKQLEKEYGKNKR